MENIILQENHEFIVKSQQLMQFFDSLADKYNLSMVIHCRFYTDGRFFLLGNQPKWIIHHLSQGYVTPAPYELDLERPVQFDYYDADNTPYTQPMADIKQLFNAGAAFNVLGVHQDYTDCTGFAVSEHSNAFVTKFMNHQNEFLGSVQDFMTQHKDELKRLDHNSLRLPPTMRGLSISKLMSDDLKRYNTLSNREKECLMLTLKGYSAHQVADKLYRSRRTIETHLHAIRQKLNCHSKSDLFEFAMANNLLNILPYS